MPLAEATFFMHKQTMSSPSRSLTVVSLVFGLLVSACTDIDTQPPRNPEPEGTAGGGNTPDDPRNEPGEISLVGDRCASDTDCGAGFCLTDVRRCSQSCTTPKECGSDGMTCGTGPDGASVCVPNCNLEENYYLPYLCVDGRSVSCAAAGDSYCSICGCADPALICKAGGCVPKANVGETCEYDFECASGNCSNFAHVCRVAVGAKCSANNCDRCLTLSDWSFCSRECSSAADCGEHACVGDAEIGVYTCTLDCSAAGERACPGTCRRTSQNTNYCDCPTCGVVGPKHELGQVCGGDFECTTELCLERPRQCDWRQETYCSYVGSCSLACTTNADCGEGTACARGFCMAKCTPPEPGVPPAPGSCKGSCLSLITADGTTSMLCEPRAVNGQPCWDNTHCASGSCMGADGICIGSAKLGDSCSIDADCAQGRCCSGKCASAC